MDSRNILLNAQLGCGALILVAIAAWFGANLASHDSRPAIGSSASRPAIFEEGKIVRRMSTGTPALPVVYRVVAVEGVWVKLKADPVATFREFTGSALTAAPNNSPGDLPTAPDFEKNPTLTAMMRPYTGEWWLNTALTTDLWQEMPPEKAAP